MTLMTTGTWLWQHLASCNTPTSTMTTSLLPATKEQLPWNQQFLNNPATPCSFAPSAQKKQHRPPFISDAHDKWQHDYEYIWHITMQQVQKMQNCSYPNPKAPLPWKYQQYLNNPATPRSFACSTRKWQQQQPTCIFGTNYKHPNMNTMEFCAFCACTQWKKPNKWPFTFSAHTQQQQPKHTSDHDTTTTNNTFSIYQWWWQPKNGSNNDNGNTTVVANKCNSPRKRLRGKEEQAPLGLLLQKLSCHHRRALLWIVIHFPCWEGIKDQDFLGLCQNS